MAQVVEHLPSKCEALSSNTSTTQKRGVSTPTKSWDRMPLLWTQAEYQSVVTPEKLLTYQTPTSELKGGGKVIKKC
jgi:hypothetical protein